MEKINYKISFLIIFLLSIVSIFSIIIYISNSSSSNNIGEVSIQKIKEKAIERESFLKDFLEDYKQALYALSQNKFLYEYLNNGKNKNELEEIFITLEKTLPSAIQIRLLDMSGVEKIRINGVASHDYNEKRKVEVVEKEFLQDKSNRYYFHRFKNLKKEEIGFSKIDLERDFGKLVIPKKETIRLGKLVFNKEGKKAGILVINVSLTDFFKFFIDTSLYNVMIVDNFGRIILSTNSKYGMIRKSFKTFLLKDLYTFSTANKILSNSEYYSKSFYSKKIDNFNTGQDLRLILSSKFEHLSAKKNEREVFVYMLLFILLVVLFPIIIYFSKVPDTLKKRIKHQMITDSLTNLPNREHLLSCLNKKENKESIVIIINIDNLSKIRNAYGYRVINRLEKVFAHYLESYEKQDRFKTLFKVGKSSFAFLYEYKDEKLLLEQTRKLQKNIENKDFIIRDDFKVLIDSTIGISTNSSRNETKLQEAEIALDIALSKKEDIKIYDKKDKNIELHKDNIRMVSKIKKAIENDDVIIHFQPIYSNFYNKVTKYETLIRLKSEGEIIYPDSFLEIAKDIKKYKKLTKIVISKSFEYFKDKNTEFSINLSLEDISSKEIQLYLFDKIKEYEIGSKLVIEIVESEAIDNFEEFVSFIKEAKTFGCKIAIDDFGSGYSNYNYIINLNDYIDYLKIDGTLVKDIHKNRKTQLLLGTLKFLCDNLGIKTIAEYIENKEIFDYIKSMGIDYSQGYYIGKPKSTVSKLIKVFE